MCECACMFVHMYVESKVLGCQFLEAVHLVLLRVTQWDLGPEVRLGWQTSHLQRSACVCALSMGITSLNHHICLFTGC